MAIAPTQTRVPLEVRLERRRRAALSAEELRAWLAAETNDTANIEAQLHRLELEVRSTCTHLRRILIEQSGQRDGAAMHAALFGPGGDPKQGERARLLLDELGWGNQARAVIGSYQLIGRVRAALSARRAQDRAGAPTAIGGGPATQRLTQPPRPAPGTDPVTTGHRSRKDTPMISTAPRTIAPNAVARTLADALWPNIRSQRQLAAGIYTFASAEDGGAIAVLGRADLPVDAIEAGRASGNSALVAVIDRGRSTPRRTSVRYGTGAVRKWAEASPERISLYECLVGECDCAWAAAPQSTGGEPRRA